MNIFQTTDPLGRSVRMKQETLGFHVVVQKNRAEFDGRPGVIEETIEKPHLVVTSNKVPDSDVYFRLGAHPEYPHLFVKVPVLFKSSGEGTVMTVFLTDNTTQGTDQPGGIKYVNYHR